MKFEITEISRGRQGVVVVSGKVYNGDDKFIARRRAYLSPISVLLIDQDEELTEQEKKLALRDLVIAQAQSWRLPEAGDATSIVRELAPSLPHSIQFDPAPLPEPNGNGEPLSIAIPHGISLLATLKRKLRL